MVAWVRAMGADVPELMAVIGAYDDDTDEGEGEGKEGKEGKEEEEGEGSGVCVGGEGGSAVLRYDRATMLALASAGGGGGKVRAALAVRAPKELLM